ncbi:MAG: hypothetical protein JO159_19710 [Acidobacteria bacterium]|nr:hypothetical protein [Acidobacteriota bacterium]
MDIGGNASRRATASWQAIDPQAQAWFQRAIEAYAAPVLIDQQRVAVLGKRTGWIKTGEA